MRRRPHVSSVTVTKHVKPGDTLTASLTLTSWSKTPVNAITLSLQGHEVYVHGQNRPTIRSLVHQVATLAGESDLEEGTRELRAHFNLPDDIPATYKGNMLAVEYKLHLHVDIPWWPDLKRSYYIDIEPREQPRPPARPVAHTTEQVGSSPFVELTLDDTTFAPGDVVSGAFALGNLRGREVQAVELAIVPIEQVTPQWKVDGRRYAVSFDPDAVKEGVSQGFRLALHQGIAPSFALVSYAFQFKARVRRGGEITHRIPIAIARFDRPSPVAAAHHQAELGAGRWRKVWARAGAPLGLSVGGKDVRLTGRIGRVDVDVFVDPLTENASLTADLRFGPWGVDLQIQPRSLVSPQRMFPFLVSDEHSEAFGSRYKAQGREEAQLRAILSSPLIQALLAFDEVRVSDDHARAVVENAGYDQRFIEPFVARVGALARALSEASGRVPPPSVMRSMLPAWAAFATELAGELSPGSMAIRSGQLEGARFDIETLFEDDPDPLGTRVAHLVDPPLSPEVEGAAMEALLAAAPPGTRAVYDEVAKGAREVRVRPHAIEATLEGPLADPAAERERMHAMLALARRLRGEKGVGPYR
ncbi:MAG TPA: hypothetical protein VE093_30490 [Polyangiaceae bacterium]|nr:hypothetical protein [Polyangiaceae bacterium]